jgi:hypothetical protein
MKAEICAFEEASAAAFASGDWSAELHDHVNACAACSELALVWQSLGQATGEQNDAPLPAPGLIWWRAQLAERREQAERAVAAIALMQKLAIALALAAAVPLLWLSKPNVWLILFGVTLFLATGAVLYGWARGGFKLGGSKDETSR